ncbi:MAG: putative rRNA maturation factor [Elusimicrobia bacterium]|nr:MAG: putative rRNA maturation factor [Elusimicrobiota bacterium]KAF0154456.1 MAG: putative rRNA maturation factor [Elusimicrobiota bacterium]
MGEGAPLRVKFSVNVVFKADPGPAPKRKSALLARAVRKALPRARGEVNLVFVGGPEIIRLNKSFLGKSHRTDVIAFNYQACPDPASDKPHSGFLRPCGPHAASTGGRSKGWSSPFGDIFVCLPQARRQARELGHPLDRELLLLALHGALHLAGMDDDTAARRAAMHRKAEKLADGL